ncbi:SAM-dependent methyltransferase, partial [Streptomyces sp. NPDC057927]
MPITDAGTAAAPMPTQATCQSTYQTRVADYWNAEENPVNLELGKIDDLYHHHYGIGDVDWSVLDESRDGGGDGAAPRRDRITAELHRLEQAQADLLASHLGPLSG